MKKKPRVAIKLNEYMFKNQKYDTNFSIASVLLSKIDEFPDITIEQIAYLANTTPGSVTKFCKRLGYHGFTDMRIDDHSYDYASIFNVLQSVDNIEDSKHQFIQQLSKTLLNIFNTYDTDQLDRIAKKLTQSKTVTIIAGHHGFAAMNLARELFSYFDIQVYETSRNSDPLIIKTLIEKSDMTMIISLTGKWIEHHWEEIEIENVHRDKLILISYDKEYESIFSENVFLNQIDEFYYSNYISNHSIQSFFILLVIHMQSKLK